MAVETLELVALDLSWYSDSLHLLTLPSQLSSQSLVFFLQKNGYSAFVISMAYKVLSTVTVSIMMVFFIRKQPLYDVISELEGKLNLCH